MVKRRKKVKNSSKTKKKRKLGYLIIVLTIILFVSGEFVIHLLYDKGTITNINEANINYITLFGLLLLITFKPKFGRFMPKWMNIKDSDKLNFKRREIKLVIFTGIFSVFMFKIFEFICNLVKISGLTLMDYIISWGLRMFLFGFYGVMLFIFLWGFVNFVLDWIMKIWDI